MSSCVASSLKIISQRKWWANFPLPKVITFCVLSSEQPLLWRSSVAFSASLNQRMRRLNLMDLSMSRKLPAVMKYFQCSFWEMLKTFGISGVSSSGGETGVLRPKMLANLFMMNFLSRAHNSTFQQMQTQISRQWSLKFTNSSKYYLLTRLSSREESSNFFAHPLYFYWRKFFFSDMCILAPTAADLHCFNSRVSSATSSVRNLFSKFDWSSSSMSFLL